MCTRRKVTIGEMFAISFLGLAFAQTAWAQEFLPTELAPRQFRTLPQVRIERGEKFTRVPGTDTYKSRRGGMMAVEGYDMEIGYDFRKWEDAWESKVRGDQAESASEMIAATNAEPRFRDFRELLGERWVAYNDNCQVAIHTAWKKLSESQKRRILRIYADPYSVYAQLPDESRRRFDVFNGAYRHMVQYPSEVRTSARVFTTRDGKTTQDYLERFPWVCLNYANVPDRLFVFLRETEGQFQGRTPASGNRLDWDELRRVYTDRAGSENASSNQTE